MCPVPVVEDGEDLTDLMDLVLHASAGPMDVAQTNSRRHAVTASHGQRLVASFRHRADAELFLRAAPALEHLIAGVSEALADHGDDGTGRCLECGQPFACRTRRTLERAAAASTVGPAVIR